VLDFEFVRENWWFITLGVVETLLIATGAFVGAALIGLVSSAGNRSTLWPLKALSTFYAWLINGIPLLLQIVFIFLALPQLGIHLPGFWSAVLVLAINYGARMSGIFGSLRAANGENKEPAWRSSIPSLAGEFTSLIKDTTLIAITGFTHEVLWRAMKVGRAQFKNLEALLLAAAIYLVLITAVSLGARAIQRMSGAQPPVAG
jgi:polar amino acid transport system permease protein